MLVTLGGGPEHTSAEAHWFAINYPSNGEIICRDTVLVQKDACLFPPYTQKNIEGRKIQSRGLLGSKVYLDQVDLAFDLAQLFSSTVAWVNHLIPLSLS